MGWLDDGRRGELQYFVLLVSDSGSGYPPDRPGDMYREMNQHIVIATAQHDVYNLSDQGPLLALTGDIRIRAIS
jgi:hypothetical protein